jgi:hypothetical protein
VAADFTAAVVADSMAVAATVVEATVAVTAKPNCS